MTDSLHKAPDAPAEGVDETLKQYDPESRKREGLGRIWLIGIAGVSVVLALFHLYTAYAGPFVDIVQRSIHLYTLLGLAFVLFPFSRHAPGDRVHLVDAALALVSIAIGCYMMIAADRIIISAGRINDIDMVVGLVALALVVDGARRVTGWGLPLLCMAALVYGFYAKLSLYTNLSESIVLATTKQIVSHLVFITEGLLGTAIAVSASYIILFILFGAFLVKSGLGALFNDLALAVAGPSRGGPAKVAVVASGFLGSINGSAIANVVTTGAFTIPLMKRTGYTANFAGAVEAAASVGGQILPPIMGAAAFIMAEVLGVPYAQIMLAGIVPALLFYLGILFQVHLRAVALGLSGIPRSELTPIREVMLRRGHLLLPMVILLWMIFDGRAPFFAAVWSIAATVLICGTPRLVAGLALVLALMIVEPQWQAWLAGQALPAISANRLMLFGVIAGPIIINLLRRGLPVPEAETMDTLDCRDAMVEGVRNAIPVAIACGAVGIVVGVATLTGIALDAAAWVVSMGQAIPSPTVQLLVTLVLTMLASIVLGMGLPSIPCYIITSTMAAPILLQLPAFRALTGDNDTAVFVAHMFVFYFGIFANLTPPVALAAYAGAGVAGGSPNATGVAAMRLAIAGFVVPYMFVFAPAMLMIEASTLEILHVAATGVLGVGLLAIAFEGYLYARLATPWRLVALVGALALIFPGWLSDGVGIAALVVILLVARAGRETTATDARSISGITSNSAARRPR
ncbi:TRAP transporter permease [Salinisphaera japonica]|uniref:C4-dicarboxylate ABC transporter permease n=1 Tax=Salinisphaera japonica YTM-1 TaxID=1209778 RepID=A0A423PNC5_9GAMM|nr:TRAP transporter permease [Salinisphaera japonica]ROO27077.1 C4-dicarboxylate ABC transporter permease [Salinisphaera japonica YTM-1]